MQMLTTISSLQALVDVVSIPMFVTDARHRYLLTNKASCEFLGRAASEILGRSYADLFPAAQAEALFEIDSRIFLSGEGAEYEEELVDGRGQVRTLLTRKQLITADDGAPLLVGLVNDITAYREAETQLRQLNLTLGVAREEAEKANAAKSAFLALISHEIRTPLNGVLGMAQAMAADRLDPPQRERLSVIRQSGEMLMSLLNDVLDMSKIEAGKLQLEQIEFELEDVLGGAHAAFAQLAGDKGVALSLDMGDARGTYRGDPTRVGQILYNLVSNAVKFTDRGEVRITAARGEQGLRLEVADTGVGMTEADVARLFTKFFQAEPSTSRRFGGTGLGLAICRQLSEMMGGVIEAQSRLGQGSTMTVMLPIERLAAPAPASPFAPSSRRSADLRERRILVAEDNSTNRLVLKTLLNQIDIEPVMAADGAAAVAAWEAGDFDLILMDVQMPVMDGVDATRAIRRAEADHALPRTPILALTANALQAQVTAYLEAGMDGHLAKPIDARALFKRIEAFSVTERTSPGRLRSQRS